VRTLPAVTRIVSTVMISGLWDAEPVQVTCIKESPIRKQKYAHSQLLDTSKVLWIRQMSLGHVTMNDYKQSPIVRCPRPKYVFGEISRLDLRTYHQGVIFLREGERKIGTTCFTFTFV
jgi:hypothetical protein